MAAGFQAGSAYSLYGLDANPFYREIEKIKRAYDDLERRAKAAGAGPRGGGGSAPAVPFGPAAGGRGGGTRAAIDETLRLAQAEARLLATQGDLQGSYNLLNRSIQQSNGGVLQLTQAKTQLAQTQNRLTGSSRSLTQNFQQLSSQLTGLGGTTGQVAGSFGQLLSAAGPIGAIGGVLGLGAVAVDLAQTGAQADLVRQRFDGLAQAAGTTGQALLEALRSASGGEISDLNLQLAANRALMLGVAKDADDFNILMAIARDRAQALGSTTGKAFDDLVTGLGRGSAEILDNLGIMISAEEVNKQYAASVGKTVTELTKAERQQALTNAVLEQGRQTIAATGGAVDSTAGTFAELGAATENATTAAGQLVAKLLELPARKTIDILVKVTGGLDTLANADQQLQEFSVRAFEGARSLDDYTQRVAFANAQLAPFGARITSLSATTFQYAQALQQNGLSAEEAFNKAVQYHGILERVTAAQTAAGTSGGAWDQSLSSLGQRAAEVASASEYNRTAVESLSQAYASGFISADVFANALTNLEARERAAAIAANEHALETSRTGPAIDQAAQAAQQYAAQLQQDALSSQIAAVNAQTLGIEKQRLAQQAQIAANTILAGGGNIAATAARLAASGKDIDVLTAAYLRLALAQQQAGVATARYTQNADRAARENGRMTGSEAAAFVVAQENKRKAQDAVNAALRDQQFALGGSVAQARILEGELANLPKGTEAYIRKETELRQLQQRMAQESARGGGAASAARLSDQQRLHNTLLGQQDRYQDQAEGLLRDHVKRQLEIERRFAEQSLEQQRRNEVDKRRSRYDFYKSLTGATGEIGQEDAQALSAQYEEAFARSQQLAQEGKAQQAQEYLALRQEQINADLEYYQSLAKAREENDQAEIGRLNALRALRQQAEAEELQQLEQGGDAILNERNAALADADAQYLQRQQDLALSAEQAGDRKIASYAREGKAIDEVNVKLQQQAALYGALPAGQTLGVSGAGATPTTAVAPPPPGAAAAVLTAVADAAVLSAIQAQTAMQSGKFDTVIDRLGAIERAVGNLQGRFAS